MIKFEGEIQMKKYNKAGVILLIALCFLCLKTQCTEIQAVWHNWENEDEYEG